MGTRGYGEEEEVWVCDGDGVSVLQDEKRSGGGSGAAQQCVYITLPKCVLKNG